MTLQPDDPKITAYALGELDDAEVAAVEAALADDPAARAEVEAIRALAGDLTAELAGEAGERLTATQRQAVEFAARRPRRKASAFRFWIPLATAAAAVLAVGVIWSMMSQRHAEQSPDPMLAHTDAEAMNAGVRNEKRLDELSRSPSGRYAGEAKDGRESYGMRRFGGLTEDDQLAVVDGKFEGQLEGVRRAGDLVQVDVFGEHGVTLGVGDEAKDAARYRFTAGTQDYAALKGNTLTVGGKAGTKKLPGGVPVILPAAMPAPSRRPAPTGPAPTEEWFAKGEARARGRSVDEAERLGEIDPTNATITPVKPVEQPGKQTANYAAVVHNPFVSVAKTPLSTFSIDVDTGSYANMRRILNEGRLPPAGAVRIEELVNYFNYDYAPPAEKDEAPFAVHVDVAGCPWAPEHRLVRIGLKGRVIEEAQRPPMNIVFLLDKSGSMRPANKLPLFKKACKLLVERLDEGDTIGIVTYASGSGIALKPTTVDKKAAINAVIDGLSAGGSTNGAAGVIDAYKMARKAFIKGGVNRVILCTDGDFNVGTTSNDELVKLITKEAESGVFLTVLGFGRGNIKDQRLEMLADKGNGNYGYIDTIAEAKKIFVEQMTGTLITIAKDVKIQVEFNPAEATAYRLIGYENRILAKEDFNDDTKDAGEIGAGHTVTALYEVTPAGGKDPANPVDRLKYQEDGPKLTATATTSGELLTGKLRYKQPDGSVSKLLVVPVKDKGGDFNAASADFKFASALASFGMILRESPHAGTYSLEAAGELAGSGLGKDPTGRRAEFVKLVKTAAKLQAAAQREEKFD